MAVTETVTLTKDDGTTYASAAEAITAFESANTSSDLTSASTYMDTAVADGDMVQSVALKADSAGYVLTRTWTDAKWADAGSSCPTPAVGNGWSRTSSTS